MNRIYISQIIFCADQLGSCRWLSKTFYFEIWMFEYGRKRTILWCQSRRSWKGWKQTIRGESKRSLGQSRRSGVKADDLLNQSKRSMGQSERSRGLKADDHAGPLSTGLAKLPFVILHENVRCLFCTTSPAIFFELVGAEPGESLPFLFLKVNLFLLNPISHYLWAGILEYFFLHFVSMSNPSHLNP